MRLSEPSWWYGAGDSRAARLLGPVAQVWGRIATRRLDVQAYRSSLPVLCAGNFTAGGTGKTPLAILLARMMVQRGERPAFLTRGYTGRIKGPHPVNPGLDTAADVGDEPLLLAREAPVMIAGNRRVGAEALERSAALEAPTVIIMDDGLQNGTLEKDLALAVVDGRRGVGNGRVIPAGPLRAPLEVQLALADAIVVNRPRGVPIEEMPIARRLRESFDGPVLEATVEPAEGALDRLAGARVVAVAGIANPARFFDLLRELGAEVLAERMFADHHAFTEGEAEGLMVEARRLGARVVTTEKDWIRLAGATGARADLRDMAETLPIELKLEARDEVRLVALIDAALTRRREEERAGRDDRTGRSAAITP